jgi:hypothetical protein
MSTAAAAARARLEALARRNPQFLAWALAEYQRAHNLDAQQLADWLGGGPTALSDLSLCSTPRPVRFERDVQRIAHYAGCDPDRLKQLLQEVLFRPAAVASREE